MTHQVGSTYVYQIKIWTYLIFCDIPVRHVLQHIRDLFTDQILGGWSVIDRSQGLLVSRSRTTSNKLTLFIIPSYDGLGHSCLARQSDIDSLAGSMGLYTERKLIYHGECSRTLTQEGSDTVNEIDSPILIQIRAM